MEADYQDEVVRNGTYVMFAMFKGTHGSKQGSAKNLNLFKGVMQCAEQQVDQYGG